MTMCIWTEEVLPSIYNKYMYQKLGVMFGEKYGYLELGYKKGKERVF
jgi:hypothetical protein